MGDDPALLTQKDINVFNSYFPDFELPLHMGLRCDLNINGNMTKSAMLAVSPNLISAFKSKGAQKVTFIKTFYISDIQHLYLLPDSVRVKLEKDNLQVEIKDSKAAALLFTQVLYRNYTLFFYKLGTKYELEVSTKEVDKFPEIKLDISPSQRFQFYFSAQCAKNQVNYRHDVCRYMHNLIITNNPIFDFSQIPIKALTGPNSILTPLIKSIQITKYIRGICWENYSYPDLLNQLSPLFGNEEKTEGIRMIHLVNCKLNGDFSKIIKSIDNSSERRACFISYWNLNDNPNLSFENFSHIIDLTLSKIIFFSISNCNIDEKVAKEIFLALSNNPNSFEIRHLEIGGVSLAGKSFVAFERFLKAINSRNTNKITLLDISSCDNLSAVLELISKELPDLEILNVSNNKFTADDFLLLTNYISRSKKLKEIDLSKTKIQPDKIGDIIKTFSKNEQLQNVTLKLNDLKLSSENLLPLFRAFLSQKELCDTKWNSIYLDSNGIDRDDLLTLTSLFKKFPNLETLSFSHNFDINNEDNKNISDALVKLLSIPSLKNLSIVGDNEHQLGSELIQFLQAKNNNLEKIDISGNQISDSGFAETIKLIKRSDSLKSISFCNNGMKNKNVLNDLLSALKNSKNFPTVKFPLFDTVKGSSKNDKNEKSEVSPESLIEDQKQIEISELFMKNRRKNGKTIELPFDHNDSFTDEFINGLADEFEKNFEGEKRFTHSCICMKIHLPLPFQRTTDTTTGIRKEVDIGEMGVYQTDSMNYVVTEECPQGVKKDKVDEVKKESKKRKEKTKKSKNDEEDEDDKGKKKIKRKKSNPEDGSDEDNKKKKKKNSKKKHQDDSDSENEEIKKKKKKPSKKHQDDSYSDSEDENKLKNKKKKTKKKEQDYDSYSDSEQDSKKKTRTKKKTSIKESDSYEETKPRKKTKTKKIEKDYSDYSDEEEEVKQKVRKDTKNKKIRKIPVSSDESSTEDKIDTKNIEYKLQTALPKNSKRKTQRRKNQSDSENDSESEPDNRNRLNHNRNRIQRNRKTDYSDNEDFNNHYHIHNKYDKDVDDEVDDEQPLKNTRRRNRNKYDDYEYPLKNAKNRNNYSDDANSDNERDLMDDDYEDDTYSPKMRKRQPPARFNNGNPKNKARLKDQPPVKRRIKEANPQLDGTFPDPYYKRKNVPITKV